MKSSLFDLKNNFSAFFLAAFLFLLALYSKQFAYLNVRVSGFPLFISEFTLVLLFLFQARKWPRLRLMPPAFLVFTFGFIAWGAVRALMTLSGGLAASVAFFDFLKQTCLFYQALWLFIPFLFSREKNKVFLQASLIGAGVAQFLGWIGFLLMGVYGREYSRLIGFPVGNEVLLPLYPLVFILWRSPLPEVYSLSFGQLWLTQFILYMKRTWVFSLLVFGFSLVIWREKEGRWRLAKRIAVSFALGIVLAIFGLTYVSNRKEPIIYHAHESESVRQRQDWSAPTKLLVSLLDNVFPYTDPLGTQVSVSQIVFKGDLLQEDKGSPSFMAFRLHLWRQAWAGFLERPIVGLGFGDHIVKTQLNGLPAFVDGRWISGPHNSFLTILNRMGLMGFLLWLGILASLAAAAWRSVTTEFALVLVAVLLSIHFFALFNVCLENPQSGIWYWLFMGMALRFFLPDHHDGNDSGRA